MAGILTKHGSNSNIRIPPESSGPRVQMQKRLDLEITAPGAPDNGINYWQYPTVLGLSSGAKGTVVFYADLNASANKQISVLLDVDSPLSFTVGESININELDHVHTVTLVAVQEVLVPSNVIVSGRNPLNTLDVSREGAIYVTHPEGDQQVDAWGLSRMSQPNVIGIQSFAGADNTSVSSNQITTGGSVTAIASSRLLALDVDTTNGASVKKTTDRYFTFNPVGALVAKVPVVLGDGGKTGVVRRWGMYDDTDGIFFELDENTLYAVHRSSTTGAVVDMKVPQSEWNTDKVDGSGGLYNLSGVHLDLTKMNMYWFDIPSSNAGRFRFGIYAASGRVICHEMDMTNVSAVPALSRTSQPVRWEIFNKAVTASPSRLSLSGCTVETEGALVQDYIMPSTPATYDIPTVNVTDQWTHLATFRSGLTLPGSGATNRRKTIPTHFSYFVEGAPIQVQVRVGVVLGGSPNFQQASPVSPAEVDIAGTYPANPLLQGIPVFSRKYPAGVTQVAAPSEFNIHGSNLIIKADGTYGIAYTFLAKAMGTGSPAPTASVQLSVDWKDV